MEEVARQGPKRSNSCGNGRNAAARLLVVVSVRILVSVSQVQGERKNRTDGGPLGAEHLLDVEVFFFGGLEGVAEGVLALLDLLEALHRHHEGHAGVEADIGADAGEVEVLVVED